MPNLPIVGNVPKGWVIGVTVVSGGVLAYVWIRHKHTAAAAATTTATAPPAGAAGDQYPPDGTTGNPSDPYSTDPATGMTYGDEQLYGPGYGTYGFGPGSGYGGFGPGGGGVPGTGGPPFSTNAAWASYAEQALSGVVDPTALSAALGVYLTGRPATSDQVGLIDQAIAIAGYPPVAGSPGSPNNPPGINMSGGGGGGGQVAVPNVVGMNKSAASKAVSAAGLTPRLASGYQHDPISAERPAAGTQVAKGSTVTLTGTNR